MQTLKNWTVEIGWTGVQEQTAYGAAQEICERLVDDRGGFILDNLGPYFDRRNRRVSRYACYAAKEFQGYVKVWEA